MNYQKVHDFTKNQQREVPEIRAGQTVRIHQKIKEGDKERVQMFEGLVIACHAGRGISATFTVRKVSDGVGVERIFPLYSPTIAKIEVVKTSKVRRAKLYYMRERDVRMKESKEQHEKYLKRAAEINRQRKAVAEKRKAEEERKVALKREREAKAAAETAAKAEAEKPTAPKGEKLPAKK